MEWLAVVLVSGMCCCNLQETRETHLIWSGLVCRYRRWERKLRTTLSWVAVVVVSGSFLPVSLAVQGLIQACICSYTSSHQLSVW